MSGMKDRTGRGFRRRTAVLCLLFAVLFAVRGQALAAPPLGEMTLQDTHEVLTDTLSFSVTYVFGANRITLDAEDAGDWLVTRANLRQMREQAQRVEEPGSGLFLINGETADFPRRIRVENGFVTDWQGRLILSERAIYTALERMMNTYNTGFSDETVVFRTSSGRVVTFQEGNRGYHPAPVDLEEEFEVLLDAIKTQSQAEREIYALPEDTEALSVGDTYIEIDITSQKLYYYKDGRRLLESDVVTGNLARGMGTPQGVFNVYSMARNVVLRGADYESCVNYWMAVHGGVGIHDASWRSAFGGTIYENNGSHGCINMPPENAKTLYENVSMYTPVIIYY